MESNNAVLFSAYSNQKITVQESLLYYFKTLNSENTRSTYRRHVRDFFKVMKNKSLEELAIEDFKFTRHQIRQYQMFLNETSKAGSVNGKITAVRSAFKRVRDDFEGIADIDDSCFDINRLKEKDKISYDPLTRDEAIQAIELVSGTRKGMEKSLLINVACSTGFRLDAIRKLKWKNIYSKNGYWHISTEMDKGKKDIKRISNRLYSQLMDHKELQSKNNTNDDRIFKLEKNTINKMMTFIRDNIDFGDRTIVFHSFKKTSIVEVGNITGGDVKAMQRHGNHSSARTTLDIYAKEKDYEDLVAVDLYEEVDLSSLQQLTKDELLQMITNMSKSFQREFLMKNRLLNSEEKIVQDQVEL